MDDEPNSDADKREQREASRRRFLKQAAWVAGLSATAGYASLAPERWPLSLKDATGERGRPRAEVMQLPQGGFAVGASQVLPDLGIARGARIDAMVKAAVDAIGGISRFIGRGDVVVIKPNVAFERAAPLGATTHPEVLAALIQLVRSAGAAEVRVADNPIEAPEACFARSGLRQAAVEAGARVYIPTPNDFSLLHTPHAALIEQWDFFARPFVGATKVIGVSPCKDHNLCRASMTTKNWYGLLGGRRNQFHQDIHTIIADLALMMRPTFVVLDGVRVLYRSGPTGGSLGDVKPGHTIVASTDSLAADAFGWAQLLERKDEPLPAYFNKAHLRGLGQPDLAEVRKKEVQVG